MSVFEVSVLTETKEHVKWAIDIARGPFSNSKDTKIVGHRKLDEFTLRLFLWKPGVKYLWKKEKTKEETEEEEFTKFIDFLSPLPTENVVDMIFEFAKATEYPSEPDIDGSVHKAIRVTNRKQHISMWEDGFVDIILEWTEYGK